MECRKNKFTKNPEEWCEHFWLNFLIFLTEALTQMPMRNGFILFQYPQLGKGDKSFQFATSEGLLCFIPILGRQARQAYIFCRIWITAGFPMSCFSKSAPGQPSSQNLKAPERATTGLGSHPVWCEWCLTLTTYSHNLCKRHERMSPSFVSWTDLFLNNLEKDSK